MQTNRKGFDDFSKSFRKAIPYLNSIYTFMASIALFGFLGYWADKKFTSKPWLLIFGLLMGLGFGFYQFYKVLMRQEERE
jgi:F0F1-type ATP synthase assembly protein I